jgi:hypothetical protein
MWTLYPARSSSGFGSQARVTDAADAVTGLRLVKNHIPITPTRALDHKPVFTFTIITSEKDWVAAFILSL